tara:strand:- start:293 stop:466 length:174 start_codon:yes stop_codon:yes gene_type:complete
MHPDAIVALSIFVVGVVGVVGALIYMKLAESREMQSSVRTYRQAVNLPVVAPRANPV